METIINWINIKDKLPTDNNKILINTKYCKYKIEIWNFDWHDFKIWNSIVYNVEYRADIPDKLDNN